MIVATGLTPLYQSRVDDGQQLSNADFCLTSLGREMVEKNTPLALAMLKKNVGMNLHFDDRRSIAFDALIRAVATFNPTLGFKFSTYATHVIYNNLHREAMVDGVIRRAWNGHVKRNPRVREKWIRAGFVGPLEMDGGRNDDATIAVYSREPEPGVDDDASRLEWIEEALHTFPERLRQIVRLRADGATLQAIGRGLGITKERVRQLETQAKKELRRRAEAEYGFGGDES